MSMVPATVSRLSIRSKARMSDIVVLFPAVTTSADSPCLCTGIRYPWCIWSSSSGAVEGSR